MIPTPSFSASYDSSNRLFYARVTLSYRDVEDLLAARGRDISYQTVRPWFLKIGSAVAHNIRRMRSTPSDYSRLDEMVVVTRG